MGNDLPFAEGQGQTAGTGTELATTGAQDAVIEKKKRKRTVIKPQMALKEKKRAQLGSCKMAKSYRPHCRSKTGSPKWQPQTLGRRNRERSGAKHREGLLEKVFPMDEACLAGGNQCPTCRA